ncbi:MAG: MoxR family ATPase [Hydrogenophaga sp.]|uniref:AAA family ATPase n=1 Tax=Hydrogenophaga sp. TaxID=1904254 RepID=UPI00257E5DAF|nr:MoxR family ATPase [Hydrogenophaga sp.]MBL0943025.1 MoxR family ATPase [Hydrogenophaga sp.]
MPHDGAALTTEPRDTDALLAALRGVGYHAPRSLATAVFLAMKLQRPLLLEGEPGVGKTELAKALSRVLQRPLLRLQCYDGMEQREALYEWNHTAQLLHMRAAQMVAPTLGTGVSSLPPEGAAATLGRPGGGGYTATPEQIEREVYQERYLIRRPLLQALQTPAPGAVLLIDEVDRADEPFEAFLLEYLGEYQVSIPELGTIAALAAPLTLLTSNRTRDLNDAVKRRCLYQWLDHPDRERELAIVRGQVPQAGERLSEQIARFVEKLRSQPFANAFQRAPGIAESVEWAKALVALDTLTLDPEVIQDTAGILFKQREDVAALLPMIEQLLEPEL